MGDELPGGKGSGALCWCTFLILVAFLYQPDLMTLVLQILITLLRLLMPSCLGMTINFSSWYFLGALPTFTIPKLSSFIVNDLLILQFIIWICCQLLAKILIDTIIDSRSGPKDTVHQIGLWDWVSPRFDECQNKLFARGKWDPYNQRPAIADTFSKTNLPLAYDIHLLP